MGTPLGPRYIPYTYMDPLGSRMPTVWLLQAPIVDLQPYKEPNAPPIKHTSCQVKDHDIIRAISLD